MRRLTLLPPLCVSPPSGSSLRSLPPAPGPMKLPAFLRPSLDHPPDNTTLWPVNLYR